eukprot:NODE_89_length_21810_cov_0.170098.p7 type:complete len:343 gc:universal NODE_89_length_21810_cov_0.170098:16823-17851(+)
MSLKHILAEKQLSSLLLTLNRPEKLNSLTTDMVIQLKSYFETSGLKILQSLNPKAFCAGGDVVGLLKDPNLGLNFFKQEYKMNLALHNRKQLMDVVCIVNGICFGGGVGISAHAPYVVISENVKYAMPETKIGLHPDVGGSFFLNRLKSGTGLLLGLTGKIVTSPWLLREIGYANFYVPSQRIPHLVKELGNITDLEVVPDVIGEFAETPEPQPGDSKILEVANDCFLNNSLFEIFDALEEKDNCSLCQELLLSLKAASPLSLHLTHRLYNLKAETLPEALRNEYRVSSRLLGNQTDFHIGVESLLIKKSKDPVKWTHNSIEDVTTAEIDEYFQPLKEEWHP